MRQRCQEALQDIEIPVPFDIHAFAEIVGRHRGREIRLIPKPDSGGPCGVCMPAADVDYVFFEPNTGTFHRDHIILHELGHLLMQHEAQSFWTADAPALLPDLDLTVIAARMLARSSFSEVAEQEAEMVATLVHERIYRRGPADSNEGQGLSGRLRVALGTQSWRSGRG